MLSYVPNFENKSIFDSMNCCSCYFRSIGYTDQYYAKKAYAHIKGGPLAPNLDGYVYFREVLGGTMVYVDISGLPEFRPAKDNMPQVGPHGFHIHELGNCDVGDVNNPFALAGGHYNPWNQPHGNHAGDFPVLFSNDGIANMSFFTNKFKVADIIGKTIIIHESPDDYRTQPTGASGRRLGCGIIKEM